MIQRPQIEVTGWEARHYDRFLNIVSLGQYKKFVRWVIEDLLLQPEEIVVDLGAGTGRMAELMLNRMNKQDRIYALEIGAEMKDQLFQRQINDSWLLIIHQRIDEPFQLSVKTTFAFISFVLHGLNQDQRLQVVENVYQNLQDGGKFCILDYNHFSIEDAPWYVRFAIHRIECAPTEDFIISDWPSLLVEKGFSNISLQQYVKGYVRLLCCGKQ